MVLVIIFIVTALWVCMDLTSQLCYSSTDYVHGRQFYDIDVTAVFVYACIVILYVAR